MELKKIKLNKLSDDTLAQRQMKGLKGGSPCCSCGCYYEYTGGASTHDNGCANAKHCYSSVKPDYIELGTIVVEGKRKHQLSNERGY